MASSTTSQVWYVYGVVPAALLPAAAAAGLDDAEWLSPPIGVERSTRARTSAAGTRPERDTP